MKAQEELRISPPEWLRGAALDHFNKQAEYMAEVNAAAGEPIYGASDVEALAMMSISYQKSMEYLTAETIAKQEGKHKAASAAVRNRAQEDRNYQSFMKLLGLDPESRAAMRKRRAKSGTGGFYMRREDE